MMRSMYSAVAGLKSHQTRMDVIGNNIANVNTEAFKASSVRFSELMYQTLSNASGGNGAAGTGGVNAKQVGLGVNTASTTINITGAGSSETTGNPFDLKLSDSQTTNFFIVSDGTNRFFTRAGSFYVDGNGFLCMTSTGYTVQGWQVDPTTGEIRKDTVSPLQVMSPANQTSSSEATTKACVSGVLDKEDANLNSDGGYVMSLGIYDDLGYAYNAKFSVKPVAQPTAANGTQFTVTLTDILDSEGKSILGADANAIETKAKTIWGTNGAVTVTYDSNNGSFVSVDPVADGDTEKKTTTLKLEGLTTGYKNPADANTVSNFKNITVDFSLSMNKSNNGKSTLKIEKGDSLGDGTGKKLGAMTGLSVDQEGKIYGSYDNGNTELLGQIAVAQFANASGLEKVGNNCYQTTLNSGEFDGIGVEVNADGSTINSGELEMSNVDLSGQFTDMIVTQRGFQANSRVITVSDTLLEELINLKR
ncbi:MAG: flagellar hook-basal body complex protein [Agathobacter sp.]|nr:flagellar hook-basal body complex protein [Agathobacter sp.]